ncbi:hypothetical protein N825_03655 [Skermanella stibiiresistens SB22]|uniref:Uncharacterized protein n=1 Tax=Skermanella stibiiresistens SB22 TaxID=1385369 RepID=W9H1V8_9PROT|nr:hypothetical protein N825_03655 [Skermanella stibiiresistens SB22]
MVKFRLFSHGMMTGSSGFDLFDLAIALYSFLAIDQSPKSMECAVMAARCMAPPSGRS